MLTMDAPQTIRVLQYNYSPSELYISVNMLNELELLGSSSNIYRQ